MSLCQPSSRRSSFLAFRANRRYVALGIGIGVIAAVWGCGGHSGTTVSTAGYQFNNFDYTNAAGGTIPTGINNNGIIVGYTDASTRPYTSFFRNTDGSFTSLSPTPTPVATPSPGSTPKPGATPQPSPTAPPNTNGDIPFTANALGLNDSNSVVGAISSAGATAINSALAGPVTSFAFQTANPLVLAPPTFAILPLATPSTTSQMAFAINNSGVIVGQYFDQATGSTPGYIYTNGKYTTLDPAPNLPPLMNGGASGITYAQGINNNGIVIGSFAVNGSTAQHGFTYNTSTGTYTALKDPLTSRITSTITLASVRFMAINDNNMAAGYYQTSNGSQYAFLYNLNTNVFTYLDDPNAAEASGYSNMQSTQITGINNASTICGTYRDGNYVIHGFIATSH